jgi:hypothetical protein
MGTGPVSDQPLWRLHDLNRIDKHRELHLVAHSVTTGFPLMLFPDGKMARVPDDHPFGVPAVNLGPLSVSAELVRWTKDQMNMPVNIMFQVSLGPGPAEGKQVTTLLGDLIQEVDRLLNLFEALP